ncbi:hypothetical protein JPSP8_16260 [Staphylococcus pseudintermedius]|uniref:Uncharacterized protein n=1 Tax=Staphylococcus pseudintermedius TaxID=283734 RepID=A0A346TP68_STAPS|nr:hypothetical protein [Staphylococcus pseudintermedius]AZB66772.1 hypothetical protein [Staphylococcus phage phiSP119-2]
MITRENIKEILNCSDAYVNCILKWAQGDEKKLVDLINTKLKERSIRPAMTILEVV